MNQEKLQICLTVSEYLVAGKPTGHTSHKRQSPCWSQCSRSCLLEAGIWQPDISVRDASGWKHTETDTPSHFSIFLSLIPKAIPDWISGINISERYSVYTCYPSKATSRLVTKLAEQSYMQQTYGSHWTSEENENRKCAHQLYQDTLPSTHTHTHVHTHTHTHCLSFFTGWHRAIILQDARATF
jgi:hypothetical protein